MHGLINYIDTKAKCRYLKKLTALVGEWTIKTPNPKCRLSSKIDGLCGIVFNRFYRPEHGWRAIKTQNLKRHLYWWLIEWYSQSGSHVGIFDPSCLVYCCPSWPPPPPPFQSKCTVYTDSGGVLSCVVDHFLQEFNTLFLTRFITYKIATPPQTKWPEKTTFRDWCL